jgi:hypothetical protein
MLRGRAVITFAAVMIWLFACVGVNKAFRDGKAEGQKAPVEWKQPSVAISSGPLTAVDK